MVEIKIQNGIDNTSLQIGDYIYLVPGVPFIQTIQGVLQVSSHDTPNMLGQLDGLTNDTLTINNPLFDPTAMAYYPGTFVMFSKDKAANNTSIVGYYAKVRLVNDDVLNDAELFSLASEITVSSK